ncbi:hypothetical protein E2493_14345 [Sphingomonas parva]|uniref:Uncharacterized protein n=1 Tax=Sphingomonas parva TaxID=2555898 RepID=A0A4Y8ZNG8_9SPHN|nr:hypothetical protein [Sphingomonas parva]TFI57548.1 hypothetical protein E2493_14345 [Sphingomonas parva]
MKIGAGLVLFACLLGACEKDSLSSAEASEAAKQHVREQLGLASGAALFSNVYVGDPVDGEPVLCGTVSGKREDGTIITPRRFAISTENPRWLLFETVDRQPLPSRPDKFIEWHTTCFNEEET